MKLSFHKTKFDFFREIILQNNKSKLPDFARPCSLLKLSQASWPVQFLRHSIFKSEPFNVNSIKNKIQNRLICGNINQFSNKKFFTQFSELKSSLLVNYIICSALDLLLIISISFAKNCFNFTKNLLFFSSEI